MTLPPIISVITPTKDRLELLKETIASVRAQTFDRWEHVIVDDGSQDGTQAYVTELSRAEPRFRYVRRPGEAGGANVCRNLGAREARGDLLVFLDSDDLLEPDALARRVETMDRNLDLDFAVSQTGVFAERVGDLDRQMDPDLSGDDLLRFLYFETPWQTTASTWRRPALEALGGFDEALPSWQDVDLHIRALTRGLRYLRLPVVDHHMRWHEEPGRISSQQRRSPKHLEAAGDIIARFEQHVRSGPGMNWSRQRALASLYFTVAELWIEADEAGRAVQLWRSAGARRLTPALVHLCGTALLMAQGPRQLRPLARRVSHKWKGWMRMRSQPELVAP